VAQGDTAHVVVTVQNLGEVVSPPVRRDLNDGWAGPLPGRDSCSLAAGATTTVDIAWNTGRSDGHRAHPLRDVEAGGRQRLE